MKTLAKCFCGFVLGWLVYMVAMVLTVYDGVLSLIFQPFMAALFSGLFVAAALVLGLALRAPKIREAWSSAGWWVLLITVAAVAVMIFHAQLGLQTEFVNPQTKEKMKTLSPVAGVVCYFLAIFPVVNLPGKTKSNIVLQAAPAPGS
jgi:hypothetical protein